MVKVDIIETKASPAEVRKQAQARTLTPGLDPAKLFESFAKEEAETEKSILIRKVKSPNLSAVRHLRTAPLQRHSFCAGQISGLMGQSHRISQVERSADAVQFLLDNFGANAPKPKILPRIESFAKRSTKLYRQALDQLFNHDIFCDKSFLSGADAEALRRKELAVKDDIESQLLETDF